MRPRVRVEEANQTDDLSNPKPASREILRDVVVVERFVKQLLQHREQRRSPLERRVDIWLEFHRLCPESTRPPVANGDIHT
jgi:hypothetical protein